MAAKYTTSQYSETNLTAILAIPRSELPDPISNIYPILMAADTGIIYKFDPDSLTIGTLPTGASGAGRWIPVGSEVLQANRTYFVRSAGNNSNTGLSAGSAFLTIQAAFDRISTINHNGFDATIDFTESFVLTTSLFCKRGVGTGKVILNGNNTGEVSVAASNTVGNGFIRIDRIGDVTLKDFKIAHTNRGQSDGNWGTHVTVRSYGVVDIENVDFGSLPNTGGFSQHLFADLGGIARISSLGYKISGGSSGTNTEGIHLFARSDGKITFATNGQSTITITNTPSFATFAFAQSGGLIQEYLNVYSGGIAAGCQKYNATLNAIINQFGGGGTNPFPGTIAGTTATGGQYA